MGGILITMLEFIQKYKKTILIVAAVILSCVLIFAIYWKATEDDRYLKSKIEEIQKDVDRVRSGEWNSFTFYIWKDGTYAQDPRFDDYLASVVTELLEAREATVAYDFLWRLEKNEYRSDNIRAALDAAFAASEDIDFVLDFVDALPGRELKFYTKNFELNRDTGLIATYIEEHGTQSFSTTQGEGYYADEEDYRSKDVVGLPTSPLYDAESITYTGDFKCINRYGVRLNSYYEETSYSSYTYYFRDIYIDFNPYEGITVWSGSYLFCFDHQTGDLIGFTNLES